MKKATQRIISLVICVLMLFGTAPLNGIAELDFSKLNILSGLHLPEIKLPKFEFPKLSFPALFETKASAENINSGTCGDNLTWIFDEETGTLTISGEGEMNGFGVISNHLTAAAWNNKKILSLIVQEGVSSIGGNAFFGCHSLINVSFPESLTSISGYSFYDCANLKEINIPGNVSFIGFGAFNLCAELDYINVAQENVKYHAQGNCLIDSEKKNLLFGSNNSIIPSDSSVNSIEDYAFSGLARLERITIPNNIIDIGKHAFSDCCMLKIIAISDSVKKISKYAFKGCKELKELTVPDGVNIIDEAAFSDCEKLVDLTLGNNVTTISNYAFNNCISLKSIYIPKSVASIGNSVFKGAVLDTIEVDAENTRFKSINNCLVNRFGTLIIGTNTSIIPDDGTVTSIAAAAFYGCSGISKIIIPDCVTEISSNSFYNVCNVSFSENMSATGAPWGARSVNGYMDEQNPGIVYADETKKEIVTCSASFDGTIVVEDSVNSIDSMAFSNCEYLLSITIPESVKHIGDSAFINCIRLNEINYGAELSEDLTANSGLFSNAGINGNGVRVVFLDNITIVPSHLFYSPKAAPNIISVDFDNNVTVIGSRAFSGCFALKTLNLPESIISIGDYAFANCKELTSINYDCFFVTTSEKNIFYNAGIDGEGISVVFGNKVDIIPDYLFYVSPPAGNSESLYGKPNIQTVIINNNDNEDLNVKIGNYAFYRCYNLQSLVLSNNINQIGQYAFEGCQSLNTIVLPENDIDFGMYSFSNTGIVDLIMPNTKVTIGNRAFYNCSNLKSLSLSEDILSIGNLGFAGCTNLESINYNVSKPLALDCVFANGGLSTKGIDVFFGENVEEIPAGFAYSNFTSTKNAKIKTVSFGTNISSIGLKAFLGCSDIKLYYDGEFADWISSELSLYNCGNNPELYFKGFKKSVLTKEDFMQTNSIRDYLFYGWYWLESVDIPDNIESIGSSAFAECVSLKTIYIPSSVSIIENRAFYHCKRLEKLYFDASNVRIINEAFDSAGTDGCGITVVFGENVVNVPTTMFHKTNTSYNMPLVVNICFSENCKVKSIGNAAFSGCSNVMNVNIPDTVKTIGYNSFGGVCNINYSDCMTAKGSPWGARSVNGYVDGYLVYSDKNKTELRVCSIAATGDIKLPKTVNTIRENAFNSCTQLTTVEIPNSVTSIGENAFYLVPNIRYSNNMSAEGSPWGAKTVDAYIENGLVYYDETKAVLTACLDKAVINGAVTVPGTVREVGEFAFTGCYEVEEITFESADVIDFASTCFADCDKLETVSSPNTDTDGITYMLDEPYAYHKAIKKTSAKNAPARLKASSGDSGVDLTEMNGILFCNRSKEGTYTVPENIRYICENAFANCKNLTISLDDCNLRRIGRNAFLNSGNYRSWDQSGLFTIGNYIISASIELSSVTVTSSYRCIADSAFENCDVLESVSFSGNGTYIGKNAFEGTPYIGNEENWENGALYMGGQLIRAKTDLRGAFTVNPGTIAIADGAFAYCTGITSVTIPASITQIGDNAFEYCYNLESVSICNGVDIIGNYAFRDCSLLGSIFIPESVEKIGDYAFMNCNALSSFNVDQANENFKSADGVLFSKNGASLIQYPAGKAIIEVYNVDAISECVRIESLAFRNCKNIENVIASVKNKENPDGTIELGYRNPFAKSSALFNNGYVIIQETCLKGWTDDTSTEFIVPEGIKSIGSNAFEGKANLTSITFNESLEEIGDSAFFGCIGLTDIVFPASLQEIGNSAFENCENLSSVEFSLNDGGSNTNLSEIGICAFAGCADNIEFINRDRLDKLGDNVGNCAFGHEDEVIESVRHEKLPTCTEPGIDSVIKYCEVCGAEHTAIDTKETVEPLGHSFTNYTYNNDATAEEDGTETSKCDRCDETDTRTVAGSKNLANYDIALKYEDDNSSLTIIATNKDDPGVIITQTAQAETIETEPTCTEHGSITYKYTFTGILAPLSTEKTVKGKSKLGHSFTNYVYNNDATIEKDGHETAKCDRCDETDTRVKPGTRITASQAVIKTGESKKVDYRAKVTITVEADNVPEGYFLAIYEGNKLLKRGTNKSVSYTIDEMTEGKTFTVRVIDDKGNIQIGADDNPLQKEIEVKVKSGFFDKIIAFFRALFHALPEVDIKP